MTTLTTKSWFEDGKLITVTIPEANIYKREWVGLTTDERGNILRTYYADMYDAAEVIEELLKEKNL